MSELVSLTKSQYCRVPYWMPRLVNDVIILHIFYPTFCRFSPEPRAFYSLTSPIPFTLSCFDVVRTRWLSSVQFTFLTMETVKARGWSSLPRLTEIKFPKSDICSEAWADRKWLMSKPIEHNRLQCGLERSNLIPRLLARNNDSGFCMGMAQYPSCTESKKFVSITTFPMLHLRGVSI